MTTSNKKLASQNDALRLLSAILKEQRQQRALLAKLLASTKTSSSTLTQERAQKREAKHKIADYIPNTRSGDALRRILSEAEGANLETGGALLSLSRSEQGTLFKEN